MTPLRGRSGSRVPLDVRVARGFDRVAENPIRWALTSVALGIFGGGTLFSLIEHGESMPDGWWWAFVSMTTVGYGDIAPASDGMRFLAIFVIVTGIMATAICTAALGGRIAERRINAAHETPELDDDVDRIVDQLQALKDKLTHPLVVQALRDAHAENPDPDNVGQGGIDAGWYERR